jgi:hypothetical protein
MGKYRKKVLVNGEQYSPGKQIPGVVYVSKIFGESGDPYILSKEGLVGPIKNGDYVMTGVEGEQWIVDQRIFDKTYELMEE